MGNYITTRQNAFIVSLANVASLSWGTTCPVAISIVQSASTKRPFSEALNKRIFFLKIKLFFSDSFGLILMSIKQKVLAELAEWEAQMGENDAQLVRSRKPFGEQKVCYLPLSRFCSAFSSFSFFLLLSFINFSSASDWCACSCRKNYNGRTYAAYCFVLATA